MAERDAGDDDYMGDLSLFLPPGHDSYSPDKRFGTKEKKNPTLSAPKSKRPKGLSWQEQRRLERERKQQEEDERTKAGLEVAIPSSNVGFKLLKLMGYSPGTALGKDGSGLAEPVGLEIRRSRAGIGVEEDAARREKDALEKNRRREEEIVSEFGSRQRTQWRCRRVVWDYRKAEAALAQLENREIVEPTKNDGDGANRQEEEEDEEEEITEENLKDILIKLRDEHRYCLYCGYQYESAEALAANCPGLTEDEH